MKSKKTILIGLDGATWKNLLPWIQQGKLPFLKKIMKKGVWAVNKSPIPGLSCPIIPSFYTGMHPTKTKTFGFRKSNGSVISSQDIKGERFWDVLGKRGYSSFIYGLATTYPPKVKNGVMISSLLTPSEDADFVYPVSEKKEFISLMKESISQPERVKLQKKYREKYLDIICAEQKQKVDLVTKYLKKKQFDFICVYLLIPDHIQHEFWKSQGLILKGYQRTEKMLKKLLEKYKGCNIIIFSDHGFGKSPDRLFFINEFLKRKGHLRFKNKFLSYLYYKVYYLMGWKIEKYFSAKAYEAIFKLIKGGEIKGESKKNVSLLNIDPSETNMNFLDKKKTKAYLSHKWGITIIKKNTRNYIKFRDQLIASLKNIIDEKTGEKIFKEIFKKEELYKNAEKYQEIPDIIFTLNPSYEPRPGPNLKLITKRDVERRVEGSHEYQRYSIFMALGPDMKKDEKIDQIEIYDLAPTILHMYNVPIPKEMDGRVLKEIFKSGSELRKREIKYEKKEEKTKREFEDKMFKSIALGIKQRTTSKTKK